MKIKPVEIADVPGYPDKYEKEAKHTLMLSVPNRWRGTALAAAGISVALVLSVSGCAFRDTAGGVPVSPPTEMIPLFEYGEGTGAIGCVAVTAPVFMSEEEAFAIISSAFEEVGLKLGQGSEGLESINMPITNLYGFFSDERYHATEQKFIVPDGFLEDMPVIFVSAADVENWHKDTEMFSSVVSYHVKKAALTLAENNPNLVVFYDPIVSVDYEGLMEVEQEDEESDEQYYARRSAVEREEHEAARMESENLLRLQTQAFIKWYQDRGET